MPADKKLEIEMGFEDDYTDGVEKAAKKTDKLDDTLQTTKESTLEANIAFQTTMDTIDRFGGAVAKIRAGLEDLELVNEEQSASLRKMEGAADLFVGTATLAIIAQHTWTKATVKQRDAAISASLAIGAVSFAMMALNAESDKQKALFSVLTGITSGLAIAQFALALGKYSSAVTGAGPAAPIMAAVIGGGLVAAGTFWASTKSSAGLQTAEGQERVVEATRSGIVELHQGETARVSRRGGTSAGLQEVSPGGAPLIGQLTIVNAFDPFDPSGQRKLADQLGGFITSWVRGLRA